MLYKEIRALTRGVLVFWAMLFGLGVLSVLLSVGMRGHQLLAYGIVEGYQAMGWMAAILAIVFGTSLPSECGDHARYALVRPVSRTLYALAIFACGAVALGIAYLFSGFIGYLPIGIETGFRYALRMPSAPAVPFYVGYLHALTWYALVAGIGVLARRAWVAAGGAVIAGVFVYVIGQTPTPLGEAMRAVNFFNPMAYYAAAIGAFQSSGTYSGPLSQLPLTADVLGLCALAVLGFAVAALRWRTLQVS